MEFRQLEYLLAVRKYGTIVRAAKELFVSQPSVTQSIQNLESDLNINLFDRQGKKVILNETGERVAIEAEQILEHYAAIREICESKEKDSVKLIVSAGFSLLSPIIKSFEEDHPNVRLTMVAGNPRLVKGDIFISSSSRRWEESDRLSVLQEELAVAVAAEHPLAGNDCITPKDLSEFQILSMKSDADIRIAENLLEKVSGIALNRKIECESHTTLCEMVQNGIGPAIVPTKTWPDFYRESIKLIPITNPKCESFINIALLHPKAASLKTKLVFRYLAAHLKASDA